VPASLVEHEHGMRTGRDSLAQLRQLRGHGLRITVREDETRTLAPRGADGAEEIGPGGALVVWG
jgi:hypothetical protein